MGTNRRRFLQSGLAAAAISSHVPISLFGKGLPDANRPSTIMGQSDDSAASTGDHGQAGQPALVEAEGGGVRGVTRLRDNRLMTCWVEGKDSSLASINNPDIAQKCFARFSADDGYTWSAPRHLFDFPRGLGSYDGGVVFVDKEGAMHLFGLHYFGCGAGGWENSKSCKSLLYHVMSTDEGKNWTLPQNCDFGYDYTGAINSVIQLRSGRILAPISYLSTRMTGRFVTKLTLSDDEGKTWRPSKGECIVDTGGHLLESGAAEPVCIELQDGRVWMLMRTQGGKQYETLSGDEGDTWTEPAPSRFISSNSPGSLLRLRDGRMIFVWNNCMGPESREGILSSYDRQILAAAISRDDGKTWEGYREVLKIQKGLWQVSYPWLTEASDGSVICSGIAGSEYFPRGVVRFGADWLTETTLKEEFKNGLADWVTFGCEGVVAVPHPDRMGAQVLAFQKPKADVPAGASLNFPFGARGSARLRLRFDPSTQMRKQHYYLALTDFFCLPRLPYYSATHWGGWGLFPSGERFMFRIAPDGEIGIATQTGLFQPEFRRTATHFEVGRWYTVDLAWDCQKRSCVMKVDERQVGVIPQLSPSSGLCYLRLWASADIADDQRMLLESVEIQIES